MAERNRVCKYCGHKAVRTIKDNICWNCREKLPLIRQLLRMVKTAKWEVELERELRQTH